MSITVTTDVFCDWCSSWTEGMIAKDKDIYHSRAMAREEGWRLRWSIKRQKYEDICPKCLEKLKEEEQ